jgi:hypothetical protein
MQAAGLGPRAQGGRRSASRAARQLVSALSSQLGKPFFYGLGFGLQILQVLFQPCDFLIARLKAPPEGRTRPPVAAATTTPAAVPMVHGMLTVLTFTALAAVVVVAMVFFLFPHSYHLLSSF